MVLRNYQYKDHCSIAIFNAAEADLGFHEPFVEHSRAYHLGIKFSACESVPLCLRSFTCKLPYPAMAILSIERYVSAHKPTDTYELCIDTGLCTPISDDTLTF
jgi:hypothetical protein